jgi:hypothetical protein
MCVGDQVAVLGNLFGLCDPCLYGNWEMVALFGCYKLCDPISGVYIKLCVWNLDNILFNIIIKFITQVIIFCYYFLLKCKLFLKFHEKFVWF